MRSWFRRTPAPRAHVVADLDELFPRRPPPRPPSPGTLSPAQLDVLEFASHGYTNAEIAALRGSAEETVKSQVREVLRRLGANSRAHAVGIAIREGLIS